jgi:hypothetical protein
MTNLSTPVASATEGATNDMPDVIDSLKRLERIGSEQSKTVQKILDAARELEGLIVEQYGRANLPRTITGFPGVALFGDITEMERAATEAGKRLGVDPKRAESMRYEFDWERGVGAIVRAWSTNARVSEDRNAALNFSRDIADGLLALIAEDLRMLQEENTSALETLGTASNAIKQSRTPPTLSNAVEEAIKRATK